MRTLILSALLLFAGSALLMPGALFAQWVQQDEQFYLPAEHNWVFRRNFPQADRLFNAFDYGHAILYERLYTRPGASPRELEEEEYDFITRRLLASPPRLPLEEAAIEREYVKLAPEAKLMFEWAHLLHRQIYDILGDRRLSDEEQDRAVAEVLAYYRSRPELAFSSRPKTMELMEGQFYSTVFRNRYPKFNGLIWAYHWLQVGLYEPLLVGETEEERQAGVTATVARFRQMLERAPENLPRVMPMTAAVAPRFAARYPEAAIIFDNLHSMHDVISDILASPEVPRKEKRAEILRAARRYRDDTSFVMSVPEWLQMSREMGVENMGGPAVGLLPAFPAPTVERGAVHHGAHGSAHPAQGDSVSPGHAGHPAPRVPAERPMDAGGGWILQPDTLAAEPGPAEWHRVFLERLMQDPVVRERIASDPVLQRMLAERPGEEGLPPVGQQGARESENSLRAAAHAFWLRLLRDPVVRARLHSDPRLHALWRDPEVQRLLLEVRRATSPAPAHRH